MLSPRLVKACQVCFAHYATRPTLSTPTLNSAAMVITLIVPSCNLSQPFPLFISASVPVSSESYVYMFCFCMHVAIYAFLYTCECICVCAYATLYSNYYICHEHTSMCASVCMHLCMCMYVWVHEGMCMYVHIYLQWTTIGWLPLCCCFLTTWPTRSITPAPVLGEPCSGHPV